MHWSLFVVTAPVLPCTSLVQWLSLLHFSPTAKHQSAHVGLVINTMGLSKNIHQTTLLRISGTLEYHFRPRPVHVNVSSSDCDPRRGLHLGDVHRIDDHLESLACSSDLLVSATSFVRNSPLDLVILHGRSVSSPFECLVVPLQVRNLVFFRPHRPLEHLLSFCLRRPSPTRW